MEQLKASGFRAPVLIAAGSTRARTLRALGMKLPEIMTANSIAEALGRSHKCVTLLCCVRHALQPTTHCGLLAYPDGNVSLHNFKLCDCYSLRAAAEAAVYVVNACRLVRTEHDQLSKTPLCCRAHTISVKSQGAGPQMELGEWAAYFAQRPSERRKLYNIVSLSLANTPLEVQAPPRVCLEAPRLSDPSPRLAEPVCHQEQPPLRQQWPDHDWHCIVSTGYYCQLFKR